VASLAGPSARANGQLVQRGPQQARRDGRLAEPAAGLRERARQQVQQALHVAVLLGEHREDGIRGIHQLRELLVLSAERFHQQAEVVDRARDVGVADFHLLRDFFREARRRREALERRGEGLAVVLQPFARPSQQLLQVGARFRVKRGEELVEVDVGRRLRQRQRGPARQLPGPGVAGVDLDGDVLQLGLGPQQQRRVVIQARILRRDFHRHGRDPAVQIHARDFADLGARDRHRLALARRHRLGGLYVGLQRVVVVPEDRHPARQLEVLVREDVAADERRDDDHRDHRDERRAVALDLVADREPAFVAVGRHHPLPSAGPTDSGPLKSGSACL